MKKDSRPIRYSGAYTSPGTPEYDHNNNVGEIPKYWNSERVPLPTNNSKRHINSPVLMPFNSTKTLPSKWDDAERWITSPILGDSSVKNSVAQNPRRPKSKSGPLGPQGLVYLSNYSPVESGNVRSFMGNSPLSTGVLVPDGLSIHYNGEKFDSLYGANDIAQSTSVPGLSDSLGESSMSSSRDDKIDGDKEDESVLSRGVHGKDMATQMSPEGSTRSFSKGRLSFSALPSTVPISSCPISNRGSKDEIRDVQVDKGTTITRRSKKQGLKKSMKDSNNVEDLTLPWNASEASKNTSKLQREEAKITAWENLQKAKAEAAIRKLEMKLEKKRSASMDRILNKLRAAQMKAQAMRNVLSENHEHEASRTSHVGLSCCVYVKAYSPSNCFCCRRNN